MGLYQSGLFGNAEVGKHDIVYGDIWLLGAHLLLVGDATNPGDIARLMRVAQGRVSAIVTDPPLLRNATILACEPRMTRYWYLSSPRFTRGTPVDVLPATVAADLNRYTTQV